MKTLFVVTLVLSTSIVWAQTQPMAITNVSVITMESEEVLLNQTLLVSNGVIEKIGSSDNLKIPKKYLVVDGRGKYIIPGLFDMHTHFFMEQGDHTNTCERELQIMLANGLTTVRIMAGHPEYLKARTNVAKGIWEGPAMFVVSPQFVGRWPWPADFKNFEITDSEQTASDAVRRFKKEGYDEIKITFMIKPEAYNAIIRTAREQGIKVTGHIGPDVKLGAALKAGQQIEHMDEFIDTLLPDSSYNHGQSVSDMNIWRKNAWATVPFLDDRKIPSLVKQVREANVYVTPTNYFFFSSFAQQFTEEQYKSKPDYKYIPSNIAEERWDIRARYWNNPPPVESREKYVQIRKAITKQLWQAGVPLMAGSDSPEWFLIQGMALHDELKTFVDAGLTPYAALQTATINPASYLGIADKTGSIKKGKQADLILLDRNPLEDIGNTKSIHAVINNGELFTKEKIEALLKVK